MAASDLQGGDSPGDGPTRAALQHFLCRVLRPLSSALRIVEHFLAHAGFDRAPWLAAAYAFGIAAWFALPGQWQWLGFISVTMALSVGALVTMREDGSFPFLRQALCAFSLMLAAGCGMVWVKSTLVGMAPIARPVVTQIGGTVIAREEQPAEDRTRLIIAIREEGTGRTIRVRVNVPLEKDAELAQEGATVRLKARLVPPAPPMLPGGYDFARAAWFQGLAATGLALGPVEVVSPGSDGNDALARLQRRISSHVREQISGSAGGIAAAFASGDRGGIAKADEDAMRDSGLTHLLSISGLHVSAVIAAAYFVALRLLGLWPWLVLRVRLPLVAAGTGALAGIGYTLLTGAEVPTIRSCLGALLVLGALALGREPLSLRLLAVAAFIVMLLWPEAVIGPGFQMSFASVIAIVALHSCAPVRTFLAPREEEWWQRGSRRAVMLLLTGVVIELALMPIGLYHFHRAGVYGALANVVAIPLTTFVTMPFIGLALLLDSVGAGAPAWWVAGQSLEGLLALARLVAAQPGSVAHFPAMGQTGFFVFVLGSLWLALWTGRARLFGLVPVALAALYLALLPPPDLLVSGDGKHVGITGLSDGELVVLREIRSDYARDNLTEAAGMDGPVRAMAEWEGARCSPEFCTTQFVRGGRSWSLLMARGGDRVAWEDLVAACAQSDIVIADRRLPRACTPRFLKADRAMLERTGGLAIDLSTRSVHTVAEQQGQHSWWKAGPSAQSPPATWQGKAQSIRQDRPARRTTPGPGSRDQGAAPSPRPAGAPSHQ